MKSNDIILKQSDPILTSIQKCFNLIERSWAALSLNIWTFVTIVFIPLALAVAAITYLLTVLVNDKDHATFSEVFGDISGAAIAASVIAIIGSIILGIYLSIAMTLTQLRSVKGKKTSFGEVINDAHPYFWRFIGLAILSALIVIVGLVFLVIPGLIASFFLMFSTLILINENTGVIEALKKSYNLVKENWKVVLSLIIVMFAIQLPSYVPVIGTAITTVLSIMYFCLPAIIYLQLTARK